RTGYWPRTIYEQNPRLREVIDLVGAGFFSPEEPGLFRPPTDPLIEHDTYMLLADFDAYCECQKRVVDTYLDPRVWHKKAVHNIARMGRFSSARTIREYAKKMGGGR